MSIAGVRRALIGTVAGFLLASLTFAAALYFTQRSLIYPAPRPSANVPEGYQRIVLQTADGLALTALYHAPDAGHRVLVFFHGNGDGWDGAALANRLLVDAGYGALLAEYRGYGANPGQPDEAGFYADGRAALAWLSAAGVHPGQIVLVGNSIGSGTATQLASETRPAGLILISGFTSLPDVVAAKLPWLPVRWLVRDSYDNRAKLGKVTAPVLILHGAADQLVPLSQARQLQAAQPRARLVVVPGFGHELAYYPAAQQLELDWLARL